jgi:uncharacterized Zn finger protein
MSYWDYYPYVTVAEKREKAARSLEKLRNKNRDINPVILNGRTIAATWWGKAWNGNLERYADFSNRIGRGRSYVRNGAVLDLRIQPGRVEALVQGTRAKPYEVSINIHEIPRTDWNRIKKASEGQMDSLQELLSGKFPRALGEIFTERGKGLFPEPREIKFSCSCPDWAFMCKHVAAALYGIGARLDTEPALFFTLRKAEMRDLVTGAVQGKSRELLKKASRKSQRVLEDVTISEMFGIDLDEASTPEFSDIAPEKPLEIAEPSLKSKRVKRRGLEPVVPRRRGRPPKSVEGNATRKAKTPIMSMKPAKRKAPAKTPIDRVMEAVMKGRKGIGVADICRKTGLEEQKVRNLVHRLKKMNRIKNIAWGRYIKA